MRALLQGQPAGLQELAVINRAGAFMQARSTNQTNVVTALAAQMPATLDLDMSGVNSVNMAGTNVSTAPVATRFVGGGEGGGEGGSGAKLESNSRAEASASEAGGGGPSC